MDLAIPDGLVTGHETLIAGLTLPDADDRHVLAAAIRCNASVIALNLEVKRLAAERAELIASLGD
jgi:hypothetical protein